MQYEELIACLEWMDVAKKAKRTASSLFHQGMWMMNGQDPWIDLSLMILGHENVGTCSAIRDVSKDDDYNPVPFCRRPSEGVRTKALAQVTQIRPSHMRNSNGSQAVPIAIDPKPGTFNVAAWYYSRTRTGSKANVNATLPFVPIHHSAAESDRADSTDGAVSATKDGDIDANTPYGKEDIDDGVDGKDPSQVDLRLTKKETHGCAPKFKFGIQVIRRDEENGSTQRQGSTMDKIAKYATREEKKTLWNGKSKEQEQIIASSAELLVSHIAAADAEIKKPHEGNNRDYAWKDIAAPKRLRNKTPK
jgi:hypothetical protein